MTEKINQNSMNFWFPKIKDKVLVPKTEFVKLYPTGENHELRATFKTKEVLNTIEKVGGFPVFVRTDQASNKHNMENSSKISSQKEVVRHINEVLYFNEMAGFMGLPYKNLAVREWLNLDYKFKAFKGTPIAKELRFFIKNGEAICYHFYWPEKAIEDYHTITRDQAMLDLLAENGIEEEKEETDEYLPDNWKRLLVETKKEALSEADIVKKEAQKIAEVFDGYWSVDFARDINGNWYMIDMAKGIESWHPDCSIKEEILKNAAKQGF